MIFAGGIPLKRDGKVVGAVGVSGGSGAQDQAVAEAGPRLTKADLFLSRSAVCRRVLDQESCVARLPPD